MNLVLSKQTKKSIKKTLKKLDRKYKIFMVVLITLIAFWAITFYEYLMRQNKFREFFIDPLYRLGIIEFVVVMVIAIGLIIWVLYWAKGKAKN